MKKHTCLHCSRPKSPACFESIQLLDIHNHQVHSQCTERCLDCWNVFRSGTSLLLHIVDCKERKRKIGKSQQKKEKRKSKKKH